MTNENNDGPASPPEGWQAEVTAETLTDERPYAVQVQIRKARERGDWAEYSRLARTNEPRRYER